MEFAELINSRYSVRVYKPDPIEDEKLNRVLEAARIAPSAANRQPFKIIVVHTKGREEELSRIYPAPWFAHAPIVICVCGIHSDGWTRKADKKNYTEVDVAIAMDHIVLAATNEGLGTCWIGAFDQDAARKILKLPRTAEPVIFTPIGYSADEPRPKIRKDLSELVSYEHY